MNPLPPRPAGSSAGPNAPRQSSDALVLPDAAACRVRVECRPRLRCGRVHPLRVRVEWLPLTAPVSPAALGTVQVRPVVPGCQVVPGELLLDPANAAPGTFYLTPLAA